MHHLMLATQTSKGCSRDEEQLPALASAVVQMPTCTADKCKLPDFLPAKSPMFIVGQQIVGQQHVVMIEH